MAYTKKKKTDMFGFIIEDDDNIVPVKKTGTALDNLPAENLILRKTTLDAPIKTVGKASKDDIAPIRTVGKLSKNDDIAPDRTWFNKGLFKDGYNAGDIAKTILGTATDLDQNVKAGMLGIGEKVVDAAATGIGALGGALGNEKLKDKAREFIARDLYDEHKLAGNPIIQSNPFASVSHILGLDTDKTSVLGEKSDSLAYSGGQLIGTMALQMGTGGLVPWWLTTGATSFGAETETAFREGADYKEAALRGGISAAADILTEKLTGGIKFGGKALDEVLVKRLTQGISNKVAKNLVRAGMGATGEGFEEVMASVANNLGEKLYNEDAKVKDLLLNEQAMDEYLESFLGGFVLGGGASASTAVNAIATGRDSITGLTDNEQRVVDAEVQRRISEQETDGKKLSKKERAAIEKEVRSELEKGGISIDAIESALGGETLKKYKSTVNQENSLRNEIAVLENMKDNEITVKQRERLTKARGELENLGTGALKEQLSKEVDELTQSDTFLRESYNEKSRKGQYYEADLKKYKSKEQQAIIQKAIDSKILNNTRRTHEFVDMISKIAADKGVSFDFTNNEKLKESGFAVDGATVNGYVQGSNISLNIQSAKALEKVVGHEITHVLEGTELYSELQTAVKQYAETKGEYATRLKALQELYKDVEDANIENELTADLIGDYLFTDEKFVNSLSTKNPNIFKKIYEEIKYLVKVATAGTKEAKELERIKRIFDKAYKQTSGNQDNSVRYDIGYTKDNRAVVFIENDIFDGKFEELNNGEITKIAREEILKHRPGIPISGRLIKVTRKSARHFASSGDSNYLKNHDLSLYEDKMNIARELDEVIYASTDYVNESAEHVRDDDIKDFARGTVLLDIAGNQYEAEVIIANTFDNELLFYNVQRLKPTAFELKDKRYSQNWLDKSYTSTGTAPLDNKSVAENDKKVNKFSLAKDSDGNSVNENMQLYMKNTKAVDADGALMKVYHGTVREFYTFDRSYANAEGNMGKGFYFTNNVNDVDENYANEKGADLTNKIEREADLLDGMAEYEDMTHEEIVEMLRKKYITSGEPITHECYLNITKPCYIGRYNGKAETYLFDDVSEEYDIDEFEDEDEYYYAIEEMAEEYVEGAIDAIESNIEIWDERTIDDIRGILHEAIAEGGIRAEDLRDRLDDLYIEDTDGNMVSSEVLRVIIESQGYDGVIDSTVSQKFRSMNLSKDTVHYIVFDSKQAKLTSNQNPTTNPDIRRSLSKKGDIAPTGKYFGKDMAFDAPIRSDIPKPITDAPIRSDVKQQTGWEEDDEVFGTYSGKTVVSPFDNRDIKEVGKRSVNAYQYDNPEVKPYFKLEAEIMLYDLQHSTKGKRIQTGSYDTGQEWTGVKRVTSPEIEYLLDDLHYSYAEIEKGLNAIIDDHGAENIAVAKKIEIILNERLQNGYTDFTTGKQIAPNQEYIDLMSQKSVPVEDDIAPVREDIAPVKQETPVDDDIAPVRNDIEPTKQEAPVNDNIAPVRKDIAPVQPETLFDDIAPVKGKERRWIGTSTESDVVDGAILPKDLEQDKITYEPIPNKKTLNNANAKLDSMGYDTAVSYFNSQFANKRVSLDDIALGERLIQEAINRNDTQTAGELIQNIAILGTELGQKVQALSIIKKLTPVGQLRMLEKTIERGKTKEDKAFEGVEMTQEMREKILSTQNSDGTYDQKKLNAAVEEVKQEIAKQMKVTPMEKVNSWRYLSMLGNPKTHIRNLVSNVAMRVTLTAKNAMARTIEDIAPIKSRTKTWKPASDEVKAFVNQTTIDMRDIIQDGGKYSEETSIKKKRDMFKNKVLNTLYNFNTDMLSKEDWWFSKPAFKNALKEYLTANGIRTNEDIANNPKIVERAKLYATEQAQIATFRQYSWLASKISEIERKNAVTNVAVGAVIPFKKTPVNIAKTGLNYSPLGFAKTLTYDIAEVKKGHMEASTLVDHIAQNTVGSALTLVGYMLAQMGFLNGSGDDDKEGEYDYQLGKQAYSLNIGDSTYSLSWLTPVAMPLFVGANAYEQLVEGEEWNPDVVMQTLAQTLDPLSEMSFLSSLDSVLSSYDSGIQKFAGIGEAMVQNYATQFLPTALGQVATVMDDKKRSTKVGADSGFKIFDETINKLIYKIPGARETLEPSTDIWGNDVKQTENLFERAIETFIAPYTRKESIASDIDAEIKDLYSKTGDDGLIPNIPNNYINYDGEKYKMSAKEYTSYKKKYGQTASDLMEDLFKSTSYKGASADIQADMVNKVYDYAADVAKKSLLSKRGVTYTNTTEDGVPVYKEDAIKGAIDNNMLLEEFDYKLKNPEKYAVSKAVGGYESYIEIADVIGGFDAKDENGESVSGLKKERTWEYINSLDLEDAQKLILFKGQGYKISNKECLEVIYYLNDRGDLSYDEKKSILEALDFKVDSQGNISW